MSEKNNQKSYSLKEWLNIDKIILSLLTKNRKKFFIRMAILFTKLGDGQLWLLFSIILFLYNVPIGLSFIFASIIQLNLQIFIKHIFKRARPYITHQEFEHLYAPPDPFSFPSGHTCAAFTMAFVAKAVFPVTWYIFLAVALFIAISRVYLAVHYPSDIAAGILIGLVASKLGVLFTSLVTGMVL